MKLSQLNTSQLMLLAAGVLAVVLVLFIPKPELIKYQSANIISEGIYWKGLGSGSGMLFDANASFVKIDEQSNRLHICYGKNETSNCQQYQIIENYGFAGAIGSFF